MSLCQCGRRKERDAKKCRDCYEQHKRCFESWVLDYSVLAEIRAGKREQLRGGPLYERPEFDLDGDALLFDPEWSKK